MSENSSALHIGHRVVVTGMAGAGKSTFARRLSAKTGLPAIHLDVHFWNPGWVEPSDTEWIADGNYHETLDLRLERAHTIVYLDTPWWLCAARAFVRGLRRPPGTQLPDGCEDNGWRRMRDEWWLMWRVWLGRQSERERDLVIVARHGSHATLHVLSSKRAVRQFLDNV